MEEKTTRGAVSQSGPVSSHSQALRAMPALLSMEREGESPKFPRNISALRRGLGNGLAPRDTWDSLHAWVRTGTSRVGGHILFMDASHS